MRSAGTSPANTSEDLPLPEGPDDGDEAMLLHPRDEFADRIIPATEKSRVLFVERLQTPVRTDRRADCLAVGDRLAAQRGAERIEALHLLTDALPFAEINPGQKLQKPGRRRIASRHQHRDDREGGLAGLADQRELALILLGIAEPMRADQDGDGLGAADRVFKRRNPAQARTKRAAVEKSR